MAPEIKRRITYSGTSIDIFSAGVVLFVMVHGVFPFVEAKVNDEYFKLIYEGRTEDYWSNIKGQDYSDSFKDLIMWIFSGEGN